MTDTADTAEIIDPEIVDPADLAGWTPIKSDAEVIPRQPDESETDYRRLLLCCRKIRPWERTTARIAGTLGLSMDRTRKLMTANDWRARFVAFDDHESREIAGAIRYATARAAVRHVSNITQACKVVAAGLDDMLAGDATARPPATVASLLRAVDSSVVGTLAPAVAEYLTVTHDEIDAAAEPENLSETAAALDDPETVRLAAELRARLDTET